jgi:hypothetical protein
MVSLPSVKSDYGFVRAAMTAYEHFPPPVARRDRLSRQGSECAREGAPSCVPGARRIRAAAARAPCGAADARGGGRAGHRFGWLVVPSTWARCGASRPGAVVRGARSPQRCTGGRAWPVETRLLSLYACFSYVLMVARPEATPPSSPAPHGSQALPVLKARRISERRPVCCQETR